MLHQWQTPELAGENNTLAFDGNYKTYYGLNTATDLGGKQCLSPLCNDPQTQSTARLCCFVLCAVLEIDNLRWVGDLARIGLGPWCDGSRAASTAVLPCRTLQPGDCSCDEGGLRHCAWRDTSDVDIVPLSLVKCHSSSSVRAARLMHSQVAPSNKLQCQ